MTRRAVEERPSDHYGTVGMLVSEYRRRNAARRDPSPAADAPRQIATPRPRDQRERAIPAGGDGGRRRMLTTIRQPKPSAPRCRACGARELTITTYVEMLAALEGDRSGLRFGGSTHPAQSGVRRLRGRLVRRARTGQPAPRRDSIASRRAGWRHSRRRRNGRSSRSRATTICFRLHFE